MIVETQEQLNKAIASVSASELIAFDTETDGLNTRINKVIGLGVHTGLLGFYFTQEDHILKVANVLKGKKLVGWNSYFDLEMIRNNYGVDLWDSLYCDVLMLKHTCDEEYPFKLKEVAAKYIGYWVKKEQEDLNESIKANGGKPGQVWLGDTQLVGKYCIQDCKMTRDLYTLFSKKLKEDNLVQFFYEDEVMPLYKEVTRFMQSNGIRVDVPALEKASAEIYNDIEDLEGRILEKISPLTQKMLQSHLNKHYPVKKSGKFAQMVLKMAGIPTQNTKSGKISLAKSFLEANKGHPYIDFLAGISSLPEGISNIVQMNCYIADGSPETFNLNSKNQLKQLLFNIMEEKALTFTELGAPQVDEDFLESIKSKYEWIPLLLDYNKLQKLKSSYIDRILERHENGTYYPTFKQHGTISGRYGGDLMQMPRKAEEGQFSRTIIKYRNLIRDFFIAKNGNILIGADYESLEPHVFAHVSGEPAIQAIFERGDDFYSTIAIATESLEGVSANKKAPNYLGKVDKSRRQSAKAYSLGIPYGMEDYALHKTLGVSQNVAADLIRGYKSAYPKLATWMDLTDKNALEYLKICSQAGRIRRFPQLDKIQDSWDINQLYNSLDLWQAYHHDEKLYEKAKKARRQLKNALNNAKNFQIQSLSASIVNRASIALNRALKPLKGKIILNIHDELVADIPENAVDEGCAIMQDVMENVYRLNVKLKAPVNAGKKYGEIK